MFRRGLLGASAGALLHELAALPDHYISRTAAFKVKARRRMDIKKHQVDLMLEKVCHALQGRGDCRCGEECYAQPDSEYAVSLSSV